MRVEWSEKMLQTLEEDYKNHLSKELMEIKYNRSWNSIYVKIKKLKYNRIRKYKIPWNKINLPDSEIFLLYNQGESMYSLAKKYNCSVFKIVSILKSGKIISRDMTYAKRKYSINENYFDIIDSEQKAYFLGLLYADGCVSKKSNNVYITLQEKDVEILEKLKLSIESDKPLYIYTDKKTFKKYYTLSLTNKHIKEKVIILGCFIQKTFSLRFPTEEQLPIEFQKHFIRGYFDGDGCISFFKKNVSLCSVSIEGNEFFLEELQKILMFECNLNKTKFSKRNSNKKETSRSMCYSGRNQVERIFNYMYKDSTIYLKRKYEKFIENLQT